MGMGAGEYVLGALSGVVMGMGFGIFLTQSVVNFFPKTEDVEQGYVVPSKLEIKVGDLRNDGAKQTMVVYDGKSYLFKLDEAGKPKVQEYEIKPVEIKISSLEQKAEAEQR